MPLSKPFYLILISISFSCVFFAYGQKNKSQLEKQKAAVQGQIEETQQILSETSSKKKATIGQLNAITKQIEDQTKLIRTYANEVKLLSGRIEQDATVINALQQDLDNLKKEYADMLYANYKSSNGFNRLSFIFGSADLSQFYMRFKYLEQYSLARKNQVQLISDIKAEIENEKTSLENSRNEKDLVLADQLSEKEKLDKMKAEQDKVFSLSLIHI